MKQFSVLFVVIALICGALFFARQWYDAQQTPPVTDSINEFDEAVYNSLTAVGTEDEFFLAEITPDNAADAIRQIRHRENYYAVFTVERFSEGTVHTTDNTVWKSGDMYRVQTGGSQERLIICDGARVKLVNSVTGAYNIVENSSDFTYESQIGVADIDYFLENTDNELVSARFAETKGRTDGNIIYIEFYYPEFDQLEKFYISADHGIVLAAETYMADELSYRLTTDSFTADYASDPTMFEVSE
ncbi:MAG: hypothetical protein E7588_09915 [Ruminococcaceae bacterium]|nr:hypothetical protein [Oscillospiraceae bacterium]